jgi:hypothetical protein
MFSGCKHIVHRSLDQALIEMRSVESRVAGGSGYSLSKLVMEAAAELKDETFWKVTYVYGDLVIDKGAFTLPGIGERCPVCIEMQEEYAKKQTVPLLLNLSKNLEVFLVCTDIHPGTQAVEIPASRTVAVSHRLPGELIGLFETLRPMIGKPARYGSFYVSAGSRNVHIVLPLLKGSWVVERAMAQVRDSDPLDLLQAEDCRQYSVDFTKAVTRVASDWRLIRMALRKPNWEASLLLLPEKLHEAVTVDGATKFSGWRRELLIELLLEGWRQAQDALESFVTEDEPHLQGSPYFLNIDKASVPTVVRYLNDCVDGRALLHCPTRHGDANGPFPDFLRWASGFPDPEQGSYVPMVLEPRCLNSNATEDFGFVSMKNPLIATSLRFKERGGAWGPTKLTKQLTPLLDRTGISELIEIYATDTVTDINKMGCGDIPEWLKALGIKKVFGKKVARNRCLEICMRIKNRHIAESSQRTMGEAAS